MTAGIKANPDGSGAIQVGGTDYITISSAGAVAIPVSLTIAGQPAGGNYVLQNYVAPATWTKPAGLKAVKVTVVGAGGAGGSATVTTTSSGAARAGGGGGGGAVIDYLPAPSIPGPVAVTAGPGTNSFGAFCSATAGSAGTNAVAPAGPVASAGGSGGLGSGGNLNIRGDAGFPAAASNSPAGNGGSSILGGGSNGGGAGGDYGGGGGGAARDFPGPSSTAGGTGAPGIVIVEEFY